jgi:hypothetical protein
MEKLQQGNWTEAWVASRLIQNGHQVASPVGLGKGCDLVVQNGRGRWLGVEVKTATIPRLGKSWFVQLQRGRKGSRKAYTNHEFDLLIAANPEAMKLWLFRYKEVEGMLRLCIDQERKPRWWLLR